MEKSSCKKGKEYLEITAFSESSLRYQLRNAGFSSSEASYGVENCKANWEKQAALKAEEYMSIKSVTKKDLIRQLRNEGFTYVQASYGAESVGFKNKIYN